MKRVLALDFGTKRIGVAVSDEGGQLARPVKTITVRPGRPPVEEIRGLVAEFSPGEIVVGIPRRLDGSPGTLAPAVERFAAEVADAVGLEVVLWDERLTTEAAREKMIEAGAGRKRRRNDLDRVAAAVILQDYLDSRMKR